VDPRGKGDPKWIRGEEERGSAGKGVAGNDVTGNGVTSQEIVSVMESLIGWTRMRDDFGARIVCRMSKMGCHYWVLYKYTGLHKYIFQESSKNGNVI